MRARSHASTAAWEMLAVYTHSALLLLLLLLYTRKTHAVEKTIYLNAGSAGYFVLARQRVTSFIHPTHYCSIYTHTHLRDYTARIRAKYVTRIVSIAVAVLRTYKCLLFGGRRPSDYLSVLSYTRGLALGGVVVSLSLSCSRDAGGRKQQHARTGMHQYKRSGAVLLSRFLSRVYLYIPTTYTPRALPYHHENEREEAT